MVSSALTSVPCVGRGWHHSLRTQRKPALLRLRHSTRTGGREGWTLTTAETTVPTLPPFWFPGKASQVSTLELSLHSVYDFFFVVPQSTCDWICLNLGSQPLKQKGVAQTPASGGGVPKISQALSCCSGPPQSLGQGLKLGVPVCPAGPFRPPDPYPLPSPALMLACPLWRHMVDVSVSLLIRKLLRDRSI